MIIQTTHHNHFKMNEQYNCIKCGEDYEREGFKTFDEEMETGVCLQCDPAPTKPSPNHIARTLKIGTPMQIEKLNNQIKEFEDYHNQKNRPLKADIATITSKVVLGVPEAKKIAHYDYMASLFWSYYKLIVKRETGKDIKPSDVEPSQIGFIKKYIHWLLGEEVENGFDVRKSIYIWGDLGIGKTTIALAGHYTMQKMKAEFYQIQMDYEFVSMDELFLETYTTDSLLKIGMLARGFWCMDELKERHLKYKHYGNDFYILSDILTARHNLWKRGGVQTIITSNINPKELEPTLSDDRLFDRIMQQYQSMKLEGTNKRKIK